MLSAPDAAIVARDPDLPGLGVLLDPPAFLEVMSEACPGMSCSGVRLEYVRYKPGASCLTLFQILGPSGPIRGYAKAFKRGRDEKLRHWHETKPGDGVQAYRRVSNRWHIGISLFPDDRRLKALRRISDPSTAARLIAAAQGKRPESAARVEVATLRYKPERRYVASVARGGTPLAVLKLYDELGYRNARAGARVFHAGEALGIPRCWGDSARHRLLLFEWMSGRSLHEELSGAGGNEAARVTGVALAELHAQDPLAMVIGRRFSLARATHVAAEAVALVRPSLASRARSLAAGIAAALDDRTMRPSHGDFYGEQVIVHDGSVSFLDFDRACLASPAADLGNFAGHLQAAVVRGLQSRERADAAIESVLAGYDARRPVPAADQLHAHTAAALLRLAPEPFRRREEGWAERTDAIVERAISTLAPARRTPVRRRSTFRTRRRAVLVDDPHGLAGDPAWSFFHPALDPSEAQRSLIGVLEQLGAGRAELREIRVTRLKPGRRCVLEYAFDSDLAPDRRLVLIGKSRIKGVNENAQVAHESLWNSGFRPGESHVCVPQPLGAVPAWGMTLQRKIDGRQADERLRDPDAPQIAARIADAIWTLHTRGTAPVRSYTLDDELRMLRERLAQVRERLGPDRVDTVVRGCERLAATIPAAPPRPIHRDFYAAQVLVEPDRIWLLDLDLYCSGDPALDVGNFLAHMIEERLRRKGSAEGCADTEGAFESRYVERAGRRMLPSIRAWTTLSLARHVYLSTQFPDRQHTSHALLDLCERRLSAGT